MKILFLCVANSARSQMAEGLCKAMFRAKVEVYSAGSEPSGIVHPLAIEVMNEVGIDISKNFSKFYETLPIEFLMDLDFLITLCADEICPTVVNRKAKRIHWMCPDPATLGETDEKKLEAFRLVREQIREKLENFGREHGLI